MSQFTLSLQNQPLNQIYHNASLRAPLRRAQGDFRAKPMKTTAYPAKSPQNSADES
ncbi:TPA: hypothetical protein ACPYV0_004776 [Citrobacter amalonaticus]